MILILADEFSGAFDLFGIAAAEGFVSEVNTSHSGLRSLAEGQKTGSALRGNIAADRVPLIT